ncbi:MAG: glycosyltransferase family 4 protein [Bacteriovoracia bacterium]
MKDVILIRAQQESDWVSCKSIVSNLESAYNQATDLKVSSIIYYNSGLDDYQLHLLAKKIVQIAASQIVFIDHKPHPGRLVSEIFKISPNYRPQLTFHIFGDFVLDSAAWQDNNILLQNYPVRFVCASEKQKNLLDSFLNSPQSTSIVPFPVQQDLFYFDAKERSEVRQQLGLSETDFLFLYTGRASLQKNVLELTKAMMNCSKLVGESLHFYFAGPFDDLCIPYKGYENPPGVYFQRWRKLSTSIGHNRIRYINNLSANELRRICNAADCFISLSTHNDEDFGMSPAEALMCGLQTILSDWGGYGGFKKIMPEFTQLLPVSHQTMRILPDLAQVQKKILMTYGCSLTSDQREQLAKTSAATLSVETVSKMLTKQVIANQQESFKGFNPHFTKLAFVFKSNPKAPFVAGRGDYSDYYFKIYRPYFQETVL